MKTRTTVLWRGHTGTSDCRCMCTLLNVHVALNSVKNHHFSSLAPRCTDDEKRALYRRFDPSGGGLGISCVDLVGYIDEGPTGHDGGAGAVDTAFEAATVAVQDEEGGVGKLLRRAQATIVEAAQVP